MSKIHITLVGSQAAPVYMGIVDTNPDKVVLICSDQTLEEANRIYNEINIECEIRRYPPVDLTEILSKAEKCRKDYEKASEITLHIAGGTKPWALAFYAVFESLKQVRLLYIDQNNRMWDLKNQESHLVNFDIDIQFRLYGNPLMKYELLDDYTFEDKQSALNIRKMRSFNFNDFNGMTRYLSNNPNSNFFIGQNGSQIEWDESNMQFNCMMKNKSGRTSNYVLKSPHIQTMLLKSGWFEYEIAMLLSKWTYSKEIRMNCIFPAREGSPKNEIDIIINTGSKLLFVECKTQIQNETDIDKFSSAVKNYGGLSSKSLFITDAPMRDKAKEKCEDNGIMTFSLQDKQLGLSAEAMLFLMLEKELFNINAR